MEFNLSSFGKIHLTIGYQKLAIAGAPVYELDIPLAFARKAPNLDEACYGTVKRVFFQDHLEMTTYDFDQFEKSGFTLTEAMTVNFAIPFDDSKACYAASKNYWRSPMTHGPIQKKRLQRLQWRIRSCKSTKLTMPKSSWQRSAGTIRWASNPIQLKVVANRILQHKLGWDILPCRLPG